MDDKSEDPVPGIVWCNSKVKDAEKLSPDVFCEWYRDVHVPDVLNTGAISEAFRGESIDPKEPQPYLTVYYTNNTNGLQQKLEPVPMSDDMFPGSHSSYDYASFETRFYKIVQLYEPELAKLGETSFIASVEYASEDEPNFHDRHGEGAETLGWRRAERYELIKAFHNPQALNNLALFYFDKDTELHDDGIRSAEIPWADLIESTKQSRVTIHKIQSYHEASN